MRRTVAALLRKDVRLELRTKETVPAMGLFAVTTFVVFHFGLNRGSVSGDLAAGVFWVTLLFVALQQLEGHVVAPQVFRISLRINPILVILSLLLGFQLYGIAGALVALQVVAVLRETVDYLRRHMVLEPWGTPAAPAVASSPGQPPPSHVEPQGPAGSEPGNDPAVTASNEPDDGSDELTEEGVPIPGYGVTPD